MKNSSRRRFISQAGLAAAALGGGVTAAAAQTAAKAPAKAAPAGSTFRAARHGSDDWLDSLPGRHRIIIDAVSPEGAGSAILFANNLFETNKAYNLTDQDLAIVIVMRHFATPFAFEDTWWAKYGKPVGTMLKFNDPKTQAPPAVNVYKSSEYGMQLPSLGNALPTVVGRGAHLAICDLATHFISGQLGGGDAAKADAIYKESVASAMPSHHFVPAGVVAINRGQERGYTLIYAG